MVHLFFDLDGTLIDSRQRLYNLFQRLVPQSDLTFEEYWNLKRQKIGHQKILMEQFGYNEQTVSVFEKEWLDLIETEEYLSYDKPFDFTKHVLQTLKAKNHKLYLITARQSKEKTLKQLNDLGLSCFFEGVFITESKKTKFDLIKESKIQLLPNDILIGDTGIDIKTAKDLNLINIAVLSGFRNREILSEYAPDFIENDIRSLVDYVKN
jgi:phosphoglycolate phosphatase